ncbi:MAG: hypothetical protein HOH25_11425 [Opitutae bacterium]|nr:hypothetical protein [Opitutae bacterium]
MNFPAHRFIAAVAVLGLCLSSTVGFSLALKKDKASKKGSDAYHPQAGDVLFQALPKGVDLVEAIEGVTRSNYSHCGVVLKGKDGSWKVFESIGLVGAIPLKNWVSRGRGKKFSAFRLKEEHASELPKFKSALAKYAGRPYDLRYRMDDKFIYCSELVYKAYRDATGKPLGKLAKLGDLNWRPYLATIRKYEGGDPPLDREMITPIDLSKAPQLQKVFDNGMAEQP